MPRKTLSAATVERHLKIALTELSQAVEAHFRAKEAGSRLLHDAVTCALPAVERNPRAFEACALWLKLSNDPFVNEVVSRLKQVASTLRPLAQHIGKLTGPDDDDSLLWNLYELLLQAKPGRARRATGTFYTPPAIARYVVTQVDDRLRHSFGLAQGLAEPEAFQILEPACGSGVFLTAIIEQVKQSGVLAQATAEHLLPRLIAIDLSPVALFLARLRLAFLLHSAGLELSTDLRPPQFHCGNALAGPSEIPALNTRIGVVLGNPPFSSLSTNEQPWIQSLIRGTSGESGYLSIDGVSLGERKTWLHDDYVKFLRLAQWCIAQNGRGIVSFVTNHGWLDNATFRIVRQQLLRALPAIDIVDLHGNFKKQEVSPGDDRDENVFGLSQGIAIATMVKRPQAVSPCVSYAELWGSRATKLQQLFTATTTAPFASQGLDPAAPWFNFVPQQAIPPEYLAAPLLTEIMPVNSTVPVTARDHFVVARTREELLERLADFCNSKISDAELRRRYFQRTRSSRYELGDSRGWKLGDARKKLMAEPDPGRFIRRCLYRPFVWRYVSWHPALIDWPRTQFTEHLLTDTTQPHNLALLARRQSSAGRECNFFWITDCLPLDGVIRSDNRGSESFFPVMQHDRQRANYLYALFFSREYRRRFAAGLAQEFPRVLFPVRPELFDSLVLLGDQLIELHLTDPHNDGKVRVADCGFTNGPIEAFHVGTYNVCRKWLQMDGETPDSPAYRRLQLLIARTIDLQDAIDEQINAAGGFPGAFRINQA